VGACRKKSKTRPRTNPPESRSGESGGERDPEDPRRGQKESPGRRRSVVRRNLSSSSLEKAIFLSPWSRVGNWVGERESEYVSRPSTRTVDPAKGTYKGGVCGKPKKVGRFPARAWLEKRVVVDVHPQVKDRPHKRIRREEKYQKAQGGEKNLECVGAKGARGENACAAAWRDIPRVSRSSDGANGECPGVRMSRKTGAFAGHVQANTPPAHEEKNTGPSFLRLTPLRKVVDL